ncbi:MAG: hypothetical protein NVV63_17940 [Opitutus sp.]|nr:hypothetical protein [Opitutus sp.]
MKRLPLRPLVVFGLPLSLGLVLAWHEEVSELFSPRDDRAGLLAPTALLGASLPEESETGALPGELLATNDSAAILAWLETQQRLHHTTLVEPALAAWASHEPDAAAEWLVRNPACMTRENVRAVALRWIERDEAAALNWIEAHLDEKLRTELFVDLLVLVSEDASVSRILASVDPRAADQAIAAVCTARGQSDPTCARLLARLISDEELRTRAMTALENSTSPDLARTAVSDDSFGPLMTPVRAD